MHLYTHTQVHMCKRCTYVCMYVCTYVHKHACYAQLHRHMHVRTHARTHTHAYKRARTHTHTHQWCSIEGLESGDVVGCVQPQHPLLSVYWVPIQVQDHHLRQSLHRTSGVNPQVRTLLIESRCVLTMSGVPISTYTCDHVRGAYIYPTHVTMSGVPVSTLHM